MLFLAISTAKSGEAEHTSRNRSKWESWLHCPSSTYAILKHHSSLLSSKISKNSSCNISTINQLLHQNSSLSDMSHSMPQLWWSHRFQGMAVASQHGKSAWHARQVRRSSNKVGNFSTLEQTRDRLAHLVYSAAWMPAAMGNPGHPTRATRAF